MRRTRRRGAERESGSDCMHAVSVSKEEASGQRPAGSLTTGRNAANGGDEPRTSCVLNRSQGE